MQRLSLLFCEQLKHSFEKRTEFETLRDAEMYGSARKADKKPWCCELVLQWNLDLNNGRSMTMDIPLTLMFIEGDDYPS